MNSKSVKNASQFVARVLGFCDGGTGLISDKPARVLNLTLVEVRSEDIKKRLGLDSLPVDAQVSINSNLGPSIAFTFVVYKDNNNEVQVQLGVSSNNRVSFDLLCQDPYTLNAFVNLYPKFQTDKKSWLSLDQAVAVIKSYIKTQRLHKAM